MSTNKMSTNNEIISPIVIAKYPTISDFNETVNSFLNIRKPSGRSGPSKPVLLKYLREMDIVENPFSAIKTKKTVELLRLEKLRKDYDLKKIADFPTHKNVSRVIRNNFNARYKTKIFKYQMDINEILEKRFQKPRPKKHQENEKIRNISNNDFIMEKRQVCLLELAIKKKEEQILKCDRIVLGEEYIIQNKYETLRKEKSAHEAYVKLICQKSSNALSLVDKETKKKDKIIKKLRLASFNKSHLNVKCIKLEDEFVRLKSYQLFLQQCQTRRDKKLNIDHVSSLKDHEMNEILKEMETETKKDKLSTSEINNIILDSSDSSKTDNVYNMSNNHPKTSKIMNDNFVDADNSYLIRLKSLLDENSNNDQVDQFMNLKFSSLCNQEIVNKSPKHVLIVDDDSDYLESMGSLVIEGIDNKEEDIPFENPQYLVNLICELERNNLSLIENVQEQDELCDEMLQRITYINGEMKSKLSVIENLIQRERNEIFKLLSSINLIGETDHFLKSLSTVDRYKSVFNISNLDITTTDELMTYLNENICNLYFSIFEQDHPMETCTLKMLHNIEVLVDLLYIQLKSIDHEKIIKAKKTFNKRRLEASCNNKKRLIQEMEALKLHKTMKMLLMPLRSRVGRKIVCRSDYVKPVSKSEKEDKEKKSIEEEKKLFA